MKFFTFALPLFFAATALAAPSPSIGTDIVAREQGGVFAHPIGSTHSEREAGEELAERANKNGVVLQISGSLITNLLNLLKRLIDSLTKGLAGSGTEDDSVAILNQLTGALGQLTNSLNTREEAEGGVLGVVDNLVSAVAIKLPEAKVASNKLHEAVTELQAIAAKKVKAANAATAAKSA